MTSRIGLVAILLFATSVVAADRGDGKWAGDDVVFRPPFTVKVPVDRQHYYEQKIGRTPYIHQGEVGIFVGEHFGLKIDVKDRNVRLVKYERNLSKADVTLDF